MGKLLTFLLAFALTFGASSVASASEVSTFDPDTSDAIFLIIALDGTFDTFGMDSSSDGDDDDDYVCSCAPCTSCDACSSEGGYETYRIIRIGTRTGGEFPTTLDILLASDINATFDGYTFGDEGDNEYFIWGNIVASDHFASNVEGFEPEEPPSLDPDFEAALLDAMTQFGLLDPGFAGEGSLGYEASFSADEFWGFFFDQNPQFSPEEYADIVNGGLAGLFEFAAIASTDGDSQSGMGDDAFLGFPNPGVQLGDWITTLFGGTINSTAAGAPSFGFFAVAEPMSLAMLLGGISLIAMRRRRKTR